jgi:hypothetical protein
MNIHVPLLGLCVKYAKNVCTHIEASTAMVGFAFIPTMGVCTYLSHML